MRIVFSGGHFSPAFAVIEECKNDNILFIGRKYAFEGDTSFSFEYVTCKRLNIPFESIPAGRLQRKLTRHTLPSISRISLGVVSALSILRKYKPDVAVVFGGYIGLSVAVAARILSIPVVVHEQTQGAGLANNIVGKFARKICMSFESSRKHFPPSKVVLTGNPVRQDVFVINKSLSVSNGPVVYVTGGSTGSHFLNRTVATILPELLADYNVIHQTGDSQFTRDYEFLEGLKSTLPPFKRKRYVIRKFIEPEEIGWVLNMSSLVVARSGINTTCELLSLGKPCLLIPLPYGQRGEQLENAELVKRLGIGFYIKEHAATPEKILELIIKMIHEQDKYISCAEHAKSYIIPHAARSIANVIQLVGEEQEKRKKKD